MQPGHILAGPWPLQPESGDAQIFLPFLLLRVFLVAFNTYTNNSLLTVVVCLSSCQTVLSRVNLATAPLLSQRHAHTPVRISSTMKGTRINVGDGCRA